MMQTWHTFVDQLEPQPATATDTVCIPGDLGILYVGGPDSTDFLQNQLSNTVNDLAPTGAQFNSFSNAKGRLIAVFRLVPIDGGYLLLMPRDIIPAVAEKLQKYVLRSQVVLADISGDFAMFGVALSPDSMPADDRFPDAVNSVTQSDSLIVLRLHATDEQQRYLILSNDADEAV